MPNHSSVYITWQNGEKINEIERALLRSRINTAFKDLLDHSKIDELTLTVSTQKPASPQSTSANANDSDELTLEQRAAKYESRDPDYTFDQLILPSDTLDEITLGIDMARVQKTVFDDWGLQRFEPHPSFALNFYGPSGTGKTLAAHALAARLGKKILIARYSDIENKYHGEGPKNVKALFKAAERDGAVLFIDEADSLLSKRIHNVSQGSEQAINSMRSELLQSLDAFSGIVIFATNFFKNYDHAFKTRLHSIAFRLPDAECLKKLWALYLPDTLPLAQSREAFVEELSQIDGISGRSIKNAVIRAAGAVALKRLNGDAEAKITIELLSSTLQKIKESEQCDDDENARPTPLDPAKKESLERKIAEELKEKTEITNNEGNS